MLVQSGYGWIELLPALPEAWKDGKVKGLRARGGYTVDMEWHDHKVTALTIHALQPGEVTVYYPSFRGKHEAKQMTFDYDGPIRLSHGFIVTN